MQLTPDVSLDDQDSRGNKTNRFPQDHTLSVYYQLTVTQKCTEFMHYQDLRTALAPGSAGTKTEIPSNSHSQCCIN